MCCAIGMSRILLARGMLVLVSFEGKLSVLTLQGGPLIFCLCLIILARLSSCFVRTHPMPLARGPACGFEQDLCKLPASLCGLC